MSTVQTFVVYADDFDFAWVRLSIDTAVLTADKATEINTFWGGTEDQLRQERGDVVRVAARLFGATALRSYYFDGGAEFEDLSAAASDRLTQDVLEFAAEGWPPLADLGIRLLAASVECPSFDSCKMEAA